MLEGFVEGGKYVVEEKLVGGRILCHDLGIEGNKRLIPLGSRVVNKLYTGVENRGVVVYDGVKVQAYSKSVLTCCRDEDGLYLKGIFCLYTDFSGFCEGGIYIFKGVDTKGNIMVIDAQTGISRKIPKGVVLSPNEYEQWCYDGSNCVMPEIGEEIWCTSIRDDLVFVGSFKKKEGVKSTELVLRCPNCSAPYTSKGIPVKIKYSGNMKSFKVDSEVCSKYVCVSCGAEIISSQERLGNLCICSISEE